LHLLNASAAHPERLYLGLEISKKYAHFAAYRLARQERPNARIVRGDGMQFMADFVNDLSVTAVHIYFPDPWWKERHRRRRVINPEMVRNIQRVLVEGGTFHFWTDVEEYFETACQTIAEHSDFRGPLEVPERQAEHDMDYRTHFERRMRLNDHPVFRARFLR
jgi:tRNA (guanine-N7-)-methyltransferase